MNTFAAELAAILETTEGNALPRARGLRLLPACNRCLGSGQYSFNGSHSRCYGCNGIGQRTPKASEELDVLEAAMEAKTSGKLATYITSLVARKRTKNATDEVMAAWKATGVSEAYDWRKASGSNMIERDRDIADINAKMAKAFDAILNYKAEIKSAEGIIAFANTVDAALETIAAAKTEFETYKENNA